MRRQNPPQASLDQARALEKYLTRGSIGTIYALFATVSFALVAMLFALFVYDNLVTASTAALAVFALMALLPAVLALLAFRLTPRDPLSIVIRGVADSRRRALPVKPLPISFKVLLGTGEALCLNFWFHSPVKCQTAAVKEQVICYVRTALEQHCRNLSEVPDEEEIEQEADRALGVVALEWEIPVLYSEVRDMHKIRDSYSRLDDLSPSEYLGTGTLGRLGMAAGR
ncbi:MAG: hypothetical protein WBD10_03675 [Acidobacteriaceae bacterium]